MAHLLEEMQKYMSILNEDQKIVELSPTTDIYALISKLQKEYGFEVENNYDETILKNQTDEIHFFENLDLTYSAVIFGENEEKFAQILEKLS